MESNTELKMFVKLYVDKLLAKVKGNGSIGKQKMCEIAGEVLEIDLEPLFRKVLFLSTVKHVENENENENENGAKKKPRAKATTTVKKVGGSKRRLNWSNIRINKECGIRAFDSEYYNSVQLEITSGELEDIKNSPMSICKEIVGRWKNEESMDGNENRFQDWIAFARSHLGDDAPDSDPASPSPSSKVASRLPKAVKPKAVKPKAEKPKAEKPKAKGQISSQKLEIDSDVVPESDNETIVS